MAKTYSNSAEFLSDVREELRKKNSMIEEGSEAFNEMILNRAAHDFFSESAARDIAQIIGVPFSPPPKNSKFNNWLASFSPALSCIKYCNPDNPNDFIALASNPFVGPVEIDIMLVDNKGNSIIVPKGHWVSASDDSVWIQVRNGKGKGNFTGYRKDGGHSPKKHKDPRALRPHAHVPGITNPDGTPWLPIKE